MKKKNCIMRFLSFLDEMCLKRRTAKLSNLFNETYSAPFLKKIFEHEEKVATDIRIRQHHKNVLKGHGYDNDVIASHDKKSELPFVKLMELPTPTMNIFEAHKVFQSVLRKKASKHNIRITGIYFRGFNCMVPEYPVLCPKEKPSIYQAYFLSYSPLAILIGEQKDWLVYLDFEEFSTVPCYYLDRVMVSRGDTVYLLRHEEGVQMLVKKVYDETTERYQASLVKTYTEQVTVFEVRENVEQLK